MLRSTGGVSTPAAKTELRAIHEMVHIFLFRLFFLSHSKYRVKMCRYHEEKKAHIAQSYNEGRGNECL